MNATIVQKVDYDGARIGKTWALRVCLSQKAVDETIAEFTKPVNYSDGPRKYEPHEHTEPKERHLKPIRGWRGPEPLFVFTTQTEIKE